MEDIYNVKGWLASRTVWFNLLTVIIVLAAKFGFVLNQDLANQTINTLVWLAPLLNIILRRFTKTPITFGRAF